MTLSGKMIKGTIAISMAAGLMSITACNRDSTLQIKQQHNMDRRGMIQDKNVDQSRVNTNLPQGGSEAEKQYRTSPNIRPSDTSGGTPNTIEGVQPVPTGSPAPSRIGPSHPHH